jgi:hypothetical protein
MHVEIPHKLSQTEAIDKVKKSLEETRPKLDGQAVIEKEEWHDNTLDFGVLVQGQRITGSLEVQEKNFVLDAKLPLLWRMFEGRIQKTIEEQIKTLNS